MKKRQLKNRTAIAIAAILFTIATGTLFFSDSADALIASPARIEIEADPGEKVNSKLNLINDKDIAKTFYFSAENFEAQEETGNPKFVFSDEDLATWIEAPSQITLEPKEKKEIPFYVNVPKDAGVGGHFAAIFWGTNPPKTAGSGQVAVGGKIGLLVFLKVRGDIVEKGEIIEFKSLSDKKLYTSLPVDFFYRFENSGNDRTKPAGETVIRNTFGGTTETIPANEKQGSVLPESVRKFYISWGREDAVDVAALFEKGALYPEKSFFGAVKAQISSFALGRYTADINLQYGLEKKNAQSKFAFYVIPWQLLLVVLIILVLVVFGGKLMLRRYNRWVIKKSQQN